MWWSRDRIGLIGHRDRAFVGLAGFARGAALIVEPGG